MNQLMMINFIEECTQSGRRLSSHIHNILSEYKNIQMTEIVSIKQFREVMGSSHQLKNKKILVALSLDQYGWNSLIHEFLAVLRKEKNSLEHSVAVLIIDGESEMYTKSMAQSIILTMNQSGCSFPGGPLVEATGSLYNFSTQSMTGQCSLEEAYDHSIRKLVERILTYGEEQKLYQDLATKSKKEGRKILCVHASKHKSSNTLGLWELLKKQLDPSIQVKEISLENGTIVDCKGCPFQVCIHFGMQNSCYYGGTIVEEVYPALEECDTLILLCPNYNDSVSANIMAFINRLTALYRKRQFYDKQIFAIIVSGYSGGDVVAKQLISALNINKTFMLPPRFSWIETANFPGDYNRIACLDQKIKSFADEINHIENRSVS